MPAKREWLVVMFGPYCKEQAYLDLKGQNLVLDIHNLLNSRKSNFTYFIAGDGKKVHRLKEVQDG